MLFIKVESSNNIIRKVIENLSFPIRKVYSIQRIKTFILESWRKLHNFDIYKHAQSQQQVHYNRIQLYAILRIFLNNIFLLQYDLNHIFKCLVYGGKLRKWSAYLHNLLFFKRKADFEELQRTKEIESQSKSKEIQHLREENIQLK